LTVPLLIVGVVGLFVGLVIDRAIRRLPLEKSMLFPWGEYCERCLQRKPIIASIPIIGLLFVGGRCPSCGISLSKRGILIQLLTAAGFMGIYYLHIGLGGRELPAINRTYWNYGSSRLVALFVYHCILYAFLLTATFTDLDYTLIPESITNWGLGVGLLLGTFWYVELRPVPIALVGGSPEFNYLAVHPGQWFDEDRWQVWFGGKAKDIPPLLEWIRTNFYFHWALNWTKYLGLLTGVVGALVGYCITRIVRDVCSLALDKEAMGLGDLWLMAMIGAFLGWQTAVIAFVLSWVSGAAIGLPVAILNRGQMIPFGPHIVLGSIAAVVWWRPLWKYFEPALIDARLFLILTAVLSVLLFITSLVVSQIKKMGNRLLNASQKPRS